MTSDSQEQTTTPTQTTDDYEYSRETYYDLIEKGKDALEDMINVARESEHPRAFEVLSGMIKNISDVNDRLMDLNKKKKELDQKDVVKQIENQQNNFYLSTYCTIQQLFVFWHYLVLILQVGRYRLMQL